jgi:hypothetical protein
MTEKYVKNSKINGRKAFASIAIILMLSVSALMITVSTTNAQQSAVTIPSNTYLTIAPNPAGAGQPVNIMFWLDNTPPQIDALHYYGWNYTISYTTPDGTVKTAGPFESDAVGGSYYVFTPDKIGTYKFKASFLGATLNITTGTNPPRGLYTWAPSQSREVDLVVQTEKVQVPPETPLPTGDWTFPISAENRDWYQIAGNWIGAGSPAYFTKAPNASHILWTKQLTFGGISGEAGWGINWYTGLLYENKFSPRIISGRLFYNEWTGPGMFASNIPQGVICVDMETGQEIWHNDSMPQISVAQILRFDSGFQSGTTAYLWSTSGSGASAVWQMYDAFTGRLLTTFQNVSGSLGSLYGPNGEILVYILDSTNNRLSMWNSTKAIIPVTGREGADTYKPWVTAVRAWKDGVQWNVSIPDVPGAQAVQFTDYPDGVILAQSTITGYGLTPVFVHVGYSTTTGEELWRKNWTDVGWGAGGPTGPGLLTFTQTKGEKAYAFFQKETMQWHVINILNGQEKWATPPLNQFTNTDFSVYDWSGQIAYGKLIVDGYSGCVVAFDLNTGKNLWTFDQGSSGLETPYGTWPSFGGVTVADGKVYFGVTEHTPNTPMLRGYRLYCLDVETGKKLWEMPGFFTSIGIAGGKLVGYAGYDNQIYCYSPGESATTVTATAGVGNGVTIQGTVTDQSPGNTGIGVPAAGTPAISDASMDSWMAYIYMQQSKPTNATGVPVTLTVKDQNNNVISTINTVSDMSGHYAAAWTPATNGLYTITATFAGSNSYYASAATTSIAVDKAPAASPVVNPTPTPTPTITSNPTTAPTPTITPSPVPEPNEGSSTAVYVGIAAVVIIAVIAAIALVLRRRK